MIFLNVNEECDVDVDDSSMGFRGNQQEVKTC